MSETTYSGVAETLEAAVQIAHDKIKSTQHKDYVISKVTAWGMQFGGFAQTRRYWAEVVEDTTLRFRSTAEARQEVWATFNDQGPG